MQTSTHETAPRSTSRAPSTRRAAPAANRKPIYPARPETTTGPLFWLAYYFRYVAELEAINRVIVATYKKRDDEPTWRALFAGQMAIEDSIEKAIAYVKGEGRLLFAHNDTTVFSQQRGAA